jgi:AraC-like DNA-binding protein
MLARMDAGYVEHPPAGLERWVECAWERLGGAQGSVARVIPDACMDLVWSQRGGLIAVGPNTSAFLAELPPGSEAIGIRLHPGCAPPLFGVSADSLRDATAPAAALWNDEGARLEERVSRAADPIARRALLLDWLRARTRRAEAPDPLVRALAGRLAGRPGAGLHQLERELGLGERQLRRRVVRSVGYGPKRLARVLRLRRALAEARAGTELAEAAFDAGYVDQPHFTNECRALAGAPPAAVLRA